MDVASRARSSEHLLLLGASLAAPIVLIVLGLVLEPDARGWGTHEQLGFRPCYPMTHWNVPCPGCGVTTAVVLTLRGRIGVALATQPLGPLLVLASLALAGWAVILHRRGQDLAAELLRWRWRRAATAAGAVLVLAWLYKAAAVRGWV